MLREFLDINWDDVLNPLYLNTLQLMKCGKNLKRLYTESKRLALKLWL